MTPRGLLEKSLEATDAKLGAGTCNTVYQLRLHKRAGPPDQVINSHLLYRVIL
jgi:hypothetical protein